MKKYYWSDTHWAHRAVIEYSQRPFSCVEEMNRYMEDQLERAHREPAIVHHLGDVAFGLRRHAESEQSRLFDIMDPAHNILISGNHDNSNLSTYRRLFGTIVGNGNSYQENTLVVEDEAGGKTYRLLLSHAPQTDLQGCDFNLYGHVHNMFQQHPDRLYQPENEFLVRFDARYAPHINVSVEMIGYRPRTLEELLSMRKNGLKLL